MELLNLYIFNGNNELFQDTRMNYFYTLLAQKGQENLCEIRILKNKGSRSLILYTYMHSNQMFFSWFILNLKS